MNTARCYPDAPVGPFEPPPATVEDARGREIAIRRFGHHLAAVDDERAAVLEMYATFDLSDRAQGIPPGKAPERREWVDRLLSGEAVNVLAWHVDDVAGHAMLVPDGDGASELAIFVHQDYQQAGIGSRLIRALLGAGAAAGIERVWLTVERWNDPAIRLYEGVGFETTGAGTFDRELALRLVPPGVEEAPTGDASRSDG